MLLHCLLAEAFQNNLSLLHNSKHTLVNFEHVSSASLIKFARSIYFAHLELIYRSAVSRPWASSNHLYASITSPPCCTTKTKYIPVTWGYNIFHTVAYFLEQNLNKHQNTLFMSVQSANMIRNKKMNVPYFYKQASYHLWLMYTCNTLQENRKGHRTSNIEYVRL